MARGVRPSLLRLRAPGRGRRLRPLPKWPCFWKGCCCEDAEDQAIDPAVLTRQAMTRQEKDSLLSMYGLDELSEGSDDDVAENPLNPEQLSLMLDRQIALTRELELEHTPTRRESDGEAERGSRDAGPPAGSSGRVGDT